MDLTIKEMQQLETEMLREVVGICQRHDIEYYLAYGSVLGAIRHQGTIPWDYDVDIVMPHNQIETFIDEAQAELPDKFYVDYHDVNQYYPLLFPRIGLRGYSTSLLHLDIFKLIGAPSGRVKQFLLKNTTFLLHYIFFLKNSSGRYALPLSSVKRTILDLIRTLMLPLTNSFIKKIFNKLCNKYDYDESDFIINAMGAYGMKEVISKSIYGDGKTVEYSDIEVAIPEQHDAYLQQLYGDYMKLPPADERETPSSFEIKELEINS